MKGKIIIKYILLLFFIFSINHLSSQKHFKTGKVIEKVYCLADSNQSYALYLPSNYTKQKQWPIIYAFDPTARGKLPVNKYAELSEQFGYIFVCSNNSRNGPREPELEAANAMFKDTKERFSIDTLRDYTTGFSGGARVACMLAILYRNITGVIGCGAGFPGDMPPEKRMNFDYTGFVGKTDMNFWEMIEEGDKLSQLNKKYIIEFFNGGHDWPSVVVYKKAFYRMETCAIRNGLIPRNDSLISELTRMYEIEMDTLSNNSSYYWRYQINNKYANYLSGLSDVLKYNSEAVQIYISEEYNFEAGQMRKIMKQEFKIWQKFKKEFSQISLNALKDDNYLKPMSWWKKELSAFKLNKNEIYISEENMMKQRINEHVWQTAWVYHNIFFEEKQYNFAIRNMEICEIVLPDMYWPNYLLARDYVKLGNDNTAINQLNEAIDKGFTNLEAIVNDEIFDELKGKKKYKALIERIK